MPLLIWPTQCSSGAASSPWMRTLTVVLATLSLQAALAYNLYHGKGYGPMRDVSVSGWKPNLGFPVIRGDAWDSSGANFVLFLVFGAILVGTVVLAYVWSRRPVSPSAPADRPAWARFRLCRRADRRSLHGRDAGERQLDQRRYLMDSRKATLVAASALLASGACLGCVSSRRGHTDWKQLEPNSARGAHVIVDRDHLAISLRSRSRVTRLFPLWPRARGIRRRECDGVDWSSVPSTWFTYRRPGRYDVKIWFRTKSPPIRLYQEAVDVDAEG